MAPAPLPQSERLGALRRQFATLGVDAVLVPRYDEHQGEYCAPHDERLAYLTGFTGSAGMCLVSATRAVLFVDGRYQVQVRQETDSSQFEIAHLIDRPVDRWLREEASDRLRLGVNTMLIPFELHDRLRRTLEQLGGQLVELGDDPVDGIWPDQPERPLGQIRAMSVETSGESSASKRARVAEKLRQLRADFLVEAQPDNIAWLLNVRASDVTYTTAPQSFLLLDSDGAVDWFVDDRKLPNDREDLELGDVRLSAPADLRQRIAEKAPGCTALVDPQYASAGLALAVAAGGGRVERQMTPIMLLKAKKNAAELQGFRACHVEDGAAWVNFAAWLLRHGPGRAASGDPITELEAEERILGYRQLASSFVGPSFHSISAAASNAAMCHYSSTPASNAAIVTEAPYLLDSGGHYLNGTTDATRTFALAPMGDDVRRAYTAVLKGFLAMLMLRFPVGTYGHQIDAFARKALWDMGLDFDHGTGHGVGHQGAIHEAPHRITRNPNPFRLEPELVLTVEPGYYREGAFGIRIENQVEVVLAENGFLKLESLTLCPIALDLADVTALTPEEIAFLDTYHARVRTALLDRVRPEARGWLLAATAPVHA